MNDDESGEIVGPIPSWLDLGPLQDIGGVRVRSVQGDWSQRNECDRPPKFLVDEGTLRNQVSPHAIGENRLPVKQMLPGRSIEELKGIHSGPVAILFNGPSLADHDLHRIKVPIIGMNRTHQGYPTYHGPQPDYLCIVDWVWLDTPQYWASVSTHPKIINGSSHSCAKCPSCGPCKITDRDVGWRATRHSRMAPFSFDLGRDGFVGPVPSTTGHLALQVAVYMGFTELYCLGFDMGGPHFDGTKTSIWMGDANRYHLRQAPLLKERGINVWLCGSPNSKCTAFEHVPFEAVA